VGVFEGLLGGFLGRKGEIEQQNLAEAQRASQREQAIFGALVNADDPEVRALAISGLLDSAQPRKKKGGLRGWLGEMESSPYLPQIQSLIHTPVTEQGTFQLPGEAEGLAGPPPGLSTVKPTIVQTPNPSAPAAQPTTSLVEQSVQPPPAPQTYVQPPPTPYSVSHPRQVFMGPLERFQQEAVAKAGADVEGAVTALMRLGLPRDKAIEQVRQEQLRKTAGISGQTYAEGEITPDPLSPTGYSQTLYLRSDPKQTYTIPAMPKTALSSRAVNSTEAVAHELFGKPDEDPRSVMARLTPEEMAQVNKTVNERSVTQAGQTTAAREAASNLAFTQKWLTAEQAGNLGVPIGSSLSDLQGFSPLTEDQRKRKDAVIALAPQVTAIEDLIRKVIPAGMNAVQASAVIASKRLRRDPDYARLEGEINRAVGNIARVLAAENGRLTQPDVERASKSLADLQGWTDTQESALARLQDVSGAMDRILADLRTGGEPALRKSGGPPPPTQMQVPGLFLGADGQLHTGSATGPVYQPQSAPMSPAVPFSPQTIRPVR
jgi:hypothetical protein